MLAKITRLSKVLTKYNNYVNTVIEVKQTENGSILLIHNSFIFARLSKNVIS
jgi:hypothetical protein